MKYAVSIGYVLYLLLGAAHAYEQSMHAFVPTLHKKLFDQANLMVFGDLRLARSAVRGNVAVTGSAEIEDFDFGSAKNCDDKSPSLTVVGSLTARMGNINNGYVIAGRGSTINHSVKMSCTKRVDDSGKAEVPPYDDLSISLNRETADLCVASASGTTEVVNGTMLFTPGESSSCYSTFSLETDDLRLISGWRYAGKDYYRNLIISVVGRYATFRNFRMTDFNPRRTLIIFCSSYGKFEFFDSRFQASILAPATHLTVMDTVVNGSMICSSLRGTIAVLRNPYNTC